MNRTKFQTRLKQPKIKTATQFHLDSYTKYENKKLKNNLNILHRLNCLKQQLNQIKKQKKTRQHEQVTNNTEIRRTQTQKWEKTLSSCRTYAHDTKWWICVSFLAVFVDECGSSMDWWWNKALLRVVIALEVHEK